MHNRDLLLLCFYCFFIGGVSSIVGLVSFIKMFTR